MPPVHAAYVLEEMVRRIKRTAHPAAGKHYFAPERLDRPFLVGERVHAHALAARERGVANVERRLAGIADDHLPVGRKPLQVVA